MTDSDIRKIVYKITLDSGEWVEFDVNIDEQTLLNDLTNAEGDFPDWTRLGNEQCPNCPLDPGDETYCPLAKSIYQTVECFKDVRSSGMAKFRITSPDRIYEKYCVLQEGLASLFGLVMGTSDCPHFDFLHPLAKHHVPFATPEETLVRVIGSNFNAHSFRPGGTFKDANDYLAAKYQAIQLVNKTMIKRINPVAREDASKNAVINLNSFAQMFEIEYEANLESLGELYSYIHE